MISIERAHRLSASYKLRPIIVKFCLFKNREVILQTYKQKINAQRNLDGRTWENTQSPTVRVGEGFPERVRKLCALLLTLLKESVTAGRKANIKYDSFCVDGQLLAYNTGSLSCVSGMAEAHLIPIVPNSIFGKLINVI